MTTEYKAWLFNPANKKYRVQLWELYSDSGEVVRIGTADYPVKIEGSIPTAPAPFADFILENGQPSLDIRIDQPVGFGSIKIADTLKKGWKDLDFEGQYAISYFGDLRWDFVDFKTTGIALTESVIDEGNRVLTINLTDFGDKLEQSIQTNIDDNEEHKLLVVSGGFNIQPQLVSTHPNLVYRYNDGSGVTMTALRDRDDTVDISTHITIDSPNVGEFTVNAGHNPAGEYRFDADRAGVSTASEIAQFLATRAGIGTITTTNFTSTVPHHVVVRDNTTINQVMAKVMAGTNGFHRITALGELNLVSPDLTNTTRLTEDEIAGNIPESSRIEKAQKVVVNYSPNASPLSDFSSDVSEANRKFYSDEFKTVEATGAAATSGKENIYTIDTYLVNESDAQALANAEAAKRTTTKRVRKLGVNHVINALNIADGLSIEHEDFSGTGHIIRLAPKNGGYSSEAEIVT